MCKREVYGWLRRLFFYRLTCNPYRSVLGWSWPFRAWYRATDKVAEFFQRLEDAAPRPLSGSELEHYLDLEAQLSLLRATPGYTARDEAQLLDDMALVWGNLTPNQRIAAGKSSTLAELNGRLK